MTEQCFLRREAYNSTLKGKESEPMDGVRTVPNAEAVVWEDKGLPDACRNCARTALQKLDTKLLLEDKGVELTAAGEPNCKWGMISKEGKRRLLVLDVPRIVDGKNTFNRTYPHVSCQFESGSILRQPKDLPGSQQYF